MELVDVTPEDSVVPVYMEVLTDEEQAERDAETARLAQEQADREAEIEEKAAAKAEAITALAESSGLSEEQIKALLA